MYVTNMHVYMERMRRKKPRKRKAIKKVTVGEWEKIELTPSGNQAKVISYVDSEWLKRMERVGRFLKMLEEQQEGAGITTNTQGMMIRYCVEATVRSVEKIIERMENAMKTQE